MLCSRNSNVGEPSSKEPSAPRGPISSGRAFSTKRRWISWPLSSDPTVNRLINPQAKRARSVAPGRPPACYLGDQYFLGRSLVRRARVHKEPKEPVALPVRAARLRPRPFDVRRAEITITSFPRRKGECDVPAGPADPAATNGSEGRAAVGVPLPSWRPRLEASAAGRIRVGAGCGGGFGARAGAAAAGEAPRKIADARRTRGGLPWHSTTSSR
jgi:hypothetical protein